MWILVYSVMVINYPCGRMKCVYTYIGYRKQSTHSNSRLESFSLQDITVLKEMKFATRMLYYIWGEISPESFLEISIYLSLSTLAVLSLAHRGRCSRPRLAAADFIHYVSARTRTQFSIWTEWDDLCLSFPLPLIAFEAQLFLCLLRPRFKNWSPLEDLHTSFLPHFSSLL